MHLLFFRNTITNDKNEEERIYMITFPEYGNQENKFKITPEMAGQGYFDDGIGKYYFRVSEKQYFDLVGKYLDLYKSSAKNIESVTYRFEELFGSTGEE